MIPYSFHHPVIDRNVLSGNFCVGSGERRISLLSKRKGTVCLYERWLTYPASDPPVKSREVKGVFYYNNTVTEGLRLVRDDKRAQQWQSSVAEFKIYLSLDTLTWHEYSYHDIPWPMSDQDHFMEYKVARYHAGKVVTISF